MKRLQGLGLHLYQSCSQKESRCFHSGLHSPPGCKAGRIATAVGNHFWGSTKPTCWLDDTLKAEHKAERFSKCLWRRDLTAAHTANVCSFGIPERDLWEYTEVFCVFQLDALLAMLFMHFLPILHVNWSYQELKEVARSRSYLQSRQLG